MTWRSKNARYDQDDVIHEYLHGVHDGFIHLQYTEWCRYLLDYYNALYHRTVYDPKLAAHQN